MTTPTPAPLRPHCSYPGCSNLDLDAHDRCRKHTLQQLTCRVQDCERNRTHGGEFCIDHRDSASACSVCHEKDVVRYGRCADHLHVPDWCTRCEMNRQSAGGLCSRCADTPALMKRVKGATAQAPQSPSMEDFFCTVLPMKPPARRALYCKVPGCDRRRYRKDFCRHHGPRCKIPNCENHVDRYGFCYKHLPVKRACVVENCFKRPKGKGTLCISHGAVKPTCSVDGCSNKSAYRGRRCRKHSLTTGRCQRCLMRQYESRGLCKRCLSDPAPFEPTPGASAPCESALGEPAPSLPTDSLRLADSQ